MEPRPAHHDPAQHDPEEGWEHGRVFVCKACEEEVRITIPAGAAREELDEGA